MHEASDIDLSTMYRLIDTALLLQPHIWLQAHSRPRRLITSIFAAVSEHFRLLSTDLLHLMRSINSATIRQNQHSQPHPNAASIEGRRFIGRIPKATGQRSRLRHLSHRKALQKPKEDL